MLNFSTTSDSIARRAEAIRRALRERPEAPVLVETSRQAEVAAIVLACWGIGRTVVFPPSLRESMLDQIATRRECVRLSQLDHEHLADALDVDPTFEVMLDGHELDPEDHLAEFFTSGSTGEPEHVKKCARQLLGEAEVLCQRFGVTTVDTVVSGVPANHLYGFLFSVLIPLCSGCRVANATPLHAESVAATCASLDATIFVSTPAQLTTLTTVEPGRFPAFAHVFSSGEALKAETRAKLSDVGLEVTEVFGSTETGGIAVRDADSPRAWQTLPGVDVRADDERRMHVRSRFTNNPEAFVATDDSIEETDRGFRHLGRIDDVVKVGGRRVSTAALSRRLEAHDAVERAEIVQIVEDRSNTTRLHGFIQSDQDATPRELRQYLLEWFEPSTIPRMHVVSEMPRTPMGKVTRKALVELLDEVESDAKPGLSANAPVRTDQDAYDIDIHIPRDSRYFEGHFPTFPILPGVTQVTEIALAQTTRLWPELTAPERIQRLKFIAPITPNVDLTLSLTRRDQEVAFRISAGEQDFCKGTFVFPQGAT